jgi:hypothetical protein
MSKVYVVIRTIGEKTTQDCVRAVMERFGNDFEVISDIKPLEAVARKTFEIGARKGGEFQWIYAVDADVILTQSREWYENACAEMKMEFDDRLFCFNGFLDCTKRGKIVGSHFFRTRYCAEVLDKIKDVSFAYKSGRAESEMCWWVRNKMALGTVSFLREKDIFGKHILTN